MEHFYNVLKSEVKNKVLSDEFNYFEKLIGRILQ